MDHFPKYPNKLLKRAIFLRDTNESAVIRKQADPLDKLWEWQLETLSEIYNPYIQPPPYFYY